MAANPLPDIPRILIYHNDKNRKAPGPFSNMGRKNGKMRNSIFGDRIGLRAVAEISETSKLHRVVYVVSHAFLPKS